MWRLHSGSLLRLKFDSGPWSKNLGTFVQENYGPRSLHFAFISSCNFFSLLSNMIKTNEKGNIWSDLQSYLIFIKLLGVMCCMCQTADRLSAHKLSTLFCSGLSPLRLLPVRFFSSVIIMHNSLMLQILAGA